MKKFNKGDIVLINGKRRCEVVHSTDTYCIVNSKGKPPEVFIEAYSTALLTACPEEDLLIDCDFEL